MHHVTRTITALTASAVTLIGCGEMSGSTGDDEGRASGGAAQTIELTADPGTLDFTETKFEAEAGRIEVVLTNPSPIPHNVGIKDEDGNVVAEASKLVSDGEQTRASATLKSGTYSLYCSPHEGSGMVATLEVT